MKNFGYPERTREEYESWFRAPQVGGDKAGKAQEQDASDA
jgi:hypothetical protein